MLADEPRRRDKTVMRQPRLSWPARPIDRAVLVPLAFVAVLCLPELLLVPADFGFWGSPAWRPMVYQNGGFWAGLLRDWRPNYPGQSVAMFATYSLLHAGPGHLAGNAIALMPLGGAVTNWLGTARFLAVCAASVLGGGLAFGLLSQSPAPMVGASGLIFGLAGALIAREAVLGREGGVRRALALAGGLALLNLAMWLLMERVAWQTHAGGALAGGLAALALGHRIGPDAARQGPVTTSGGAAAGLRASGVIPSAVPSTSAKTRS